MPAKDNCGFEATHNRPTMKTLVEWLAYCERQHPRSIELGLERVADLRQRMGLTLSCPVFTVAGTNGKGSTCAMLEAILEAAGYRTGVYSSPHLVAFEERCRVRGQAVNASDLIADFEAVEIARGSKEQKTELTYFEFTTLAILRHLARQNLDVVILEVGLGGRLDAVNVIDADCSIVTSIDLDHQALLGPDRETIGREKAGIFRAGRPAIVSDPMPPASVIHHALSLGADLWLAGRDFAAASADRQQWAWACSDERGGRRLHALALPALRGANQLVNAAGVLAALTALHDRLPVTAQAVRQGLAGVVLPGRFQIVPGEPVAVLDVAHNPHAVATLAVNLDAMGFYPRTHAVFAAMADKDIAGMVRAIGHLVDAWYLCDLPLERAASADAVQRICQATMPGLRKGDTPCTVYPGPAQAVRAAFDAADPTDRILVFGSFLTVGGVMAEGLPRTGTRHSTPKT